MCRLRARRVWDDIRYWIFGRYAVRRQLPQTWLEFPYSWCPLNRHDDSSSK